MRATHPLGQHLATCTGPDNCQEYLSVLTMSATTPDLYRRFLVNDSARQVATRRAAPPAPVVELDYAPLDPYNLVWPAQVEVDPLNEYAPPNPYPHLEGDQS